MQAMSRMQPKVTPGTVAQSATYQAVTITGIADGSRERLAISINNLDAEY